MGSEGGTICGHRSSGGLLGYWFLYAKFWVLEVAEIFCFEWWGGVLLGGLDHGAKYHMLHETF